VVEIIVNCFTGKKESGREGGFVREEENSEAAEDERRNYALADAIVTQKKVIE
jgi:hypothetical protein